MSEQRTTPEQRQALRARYTPEPVPRCPHCGGKRALAWAFEPRLQMHLFRCATPECRERRPDTDTLASTGDQGVLALCDDAEALAGARAEIGRLRAALRRCEPFLALYQCAGQTEGDELSALEADIAAELGTEGASE